jgi:hypothetical protein
MRIDKQGKNHFPQTVKMVQAGSGKGTAAVGGLHEQCGSMKSKKSNENRVEEILNMVVCVEFLPTISRICSIW